MLSDLAQSLRVSRGLAHKADIAPVVRAVRQIPDTAIKLGDDCAAIPDGEGFLLLAIEGFLQDFVEAEPYFAGWSGVMVNASDIAAMGGRPIAVVDAIWSQGHAAASPILAGLADAAAAYAVPIIGGHTNTRALGSNLSVAILGRATRLLTSFDAKPGDTLIAAIDLRGRMRDPHPFWDASSGAPPDRLRADLDLLPRIAEAELAVAAKDISNAGIIGTAAMLADCSRVGACIDLRAIPRPDHVPLDRWLQAFPSFGFLIACGAGTPATIIDLFAARGIAAAAIGTCDDSRTLRITDGNTIEKIWDFHERALLGVAA
jgi:AIR synthase-related protein